MAAHQTIDNYKIGDKILNINIDQNMISFYDHLYTHYNQFASDITSLICYSSIYGDTPIYKELISDHHSADLATILPNLTELTLRNIILDKSDLINCTKLEYLELYNCKCMGATAGMGAAAGMGDSLDLSKNTNIKVFYLFNTDIKKIDFSDYSEITRIQIDKTNLEEIILTNCSQLEELFITNTNVTNIDLSNNKNLTEINLTNNKLNDFYICFKKIRNIVYFRK